MPGERSVTLAKRVCNQTVDEPCEGDDSHQVLMDVGVRIANTYTKQRERIAMLDTAESAERALEACKRLIAKVECQIEDEAEDHDCLRSPLSRLGDWFAGLFAIDPTITID